jgi:DNA repair protein RadC
MPSIKTLPAHLRPREKLLELGAENLSDAELLAIALRSGCRGSSVVAMAQALLQKFSLLEILEGKNAELQRVPGMSALKCLELRAGYELYRRPAAAGRSSTATIDTPQAAAHHCGYIAKKSQEHFVGLYVNGQKQLLHTATLAIGGLNMLHIHPREVFALALHHHASSLILAHNHPSDSLTASAEDIATTERLKQAGELLGVEVLDHLIFTKTGFMSMREEGVL